MSPVQSHTTRVSLLIALILSCSVFALSQSDGAVSKNSAAMSGLIFKVEQSTGQILADRFVSAELKGATVLAARGVPGWSLVGAANFGSSARTGMVYSSNSSSALAVLFYGGAAGTDLLGSGTLATPGKNWKAVAVANLDGTAKSDVLFTNAAGQVQALSYGGPKGTALLGRKMIGPLSVTGWNIVGATKSQSSGQAALVLQDPSTRKVVLDYLGGNGGTVVTATEPLAGDFKGWTAAGMRDMNGDGNPDLVVYNDATGQSKVIYYAGALGVTPSGESALDSAGTRGWKTLVPSMSTAPQTVAATEVQSGLQVAQGQAKVKGGSSVPVLVFNGTGTIANDVTAVESIVKTAGLAYHTANSSQLDGMTQSQLAAYRLFIVPGGDSITIGKNLSARATSNVRAAVEQNGMNYLGICAGGFFGGFSAYYNGLNLTSGTWFSFYADYNKGIHKEPVMISFPSQGALDIYWQNGPDLSGWGSVVGKYPNGHPAIVEGHWGQGLVILSGVHPEAPASWRIGMNFQTPVDVDLAYAGKLVNAALNGSMLPHY